MSDPAEDMLMLRAMLAQYGQQPLQDQSAQASLDARRDVRAAMGGENLSGSLDGSYRYEDPDTGRVRGMSLEDRDLFQHGDRMNAIYEALRQRRAGGGSL